MEQRTYSGDYEPVTKEEYKEALKIAEDVFKRVKTAATLTAIQSVKIYCKEKSKMIKSYG